MGALKRSTTRRWCARIGLLALISTTMIPTSAMAQSQELAQLIFRMQQMEESIRSLTGQVETLQYEVNQLKQMVDRSAQDTEARLTALEGGDAGKTDAAVQSGGAVPAAGLPQIPDRLPAEPPANPALSPVPLAQPGDGLGDSRDPLLGGPGRESALGTLSEEDLANLGRGRPLNLSLDGGQDVSNGDARAQYEAGYDAIVRGDYGFAEEQFRQFVALYPQDAQAPDATNWLGEALMARGAYEEAADALLTGFQAYPESPRAPDLLLKLGIALAGAGEPETACRTFSEVSRRYTSVSPAFANRLAEERTRHQCPA
ncbi:tol-pal system protein YbgF [Devosia enhydra]|uniref:Cell division coordinator CpoB n=1 Tax=Devosia enhydra TaxID=665118 RepID=A0A1K2HXE5_9HYPH|nr:tol-pal system protein YbgF [Devosia enhydra]SFZ83580.1 tol-pal system protein YbgF [Devosia enhydra]